VGQRPQKGLKKGAWGSAPQKELKKDKNKGGRERREVEEETRGIIFRGR
jgi:hypothetical protein